MVYENLPMEMSPEWKAITKCESRIEALEKKLNEHDQEKFRDLCHPTKIEYLNLIKELTDLKYDWVESRHLSKRMDLVIGVQTQIAELEKRVDGEVTEMKDNYAELKSVLKELSAKDDKKPDSDDTNPLYIILDSMIKDGINTFDFFIEYRSIRFNIEIKKEAEKQ